MPTFTTNYNLAKPLVNSAVDQDLWGTELNSDLDIIDTTMKTIADAVPSAATVAALVYPVGSLYWNKTNATNPATLLGFGTWVAITDKFIVARGSTYTAAGGAAQVTLSTGNLPPHQHINSHPASDTSPYNTYGMSAVAASVRVSPIAAASLLPLTSSVGSGTPFDIIPPYQAAYCWERTA
tara:strand:+ start:2446 stop:2988 length:543 start_codon:yes stop_codon:yes gene_type:complete